MHIRIITATLSLMVISDMPCALADAMPIKGFVFDAHKSYPATKGTNGERTVKSVVLEGTSCQVDLTYYPASPDGIALLGRVDKLSCTESYETKLFASGKGSAIGDLVNADGSVSMIRVSLWF